MAFSFGDAVVPSWQIFFLGKRVVCLLSATPVVPGHALVCTRHKCSAFSALPSDERDELWDVAAKVGSELEKAFEGTSLTYVVQEGKPAGQTVPHVHVHVLPRRSGDYDPKDLIYDALEGKKVVYPAGAHTSTEKLQAESERLRNLFPDSLPFPDHP